MPGSILNQSVSIIIPTLNEAEYLPQTISAIYSNAQNVVEIVVVDCGSEDQTVELAYQVGLTNIHVKGEFKGCKFMALNYGAKQATGDVLLFLDADSTPPANFDHLILSSLQDSEVVGGAFRLEFDTSHYAMKIIETINHFRYSVRHRFYGDQGIFVRRNIHEAVGGFPALSIMEAAHYCKILKKYGRLDLVNEQPMKTSSRRFMEKGILKTFFNDAKIWAIDLVGLSTRRFAANYWNYNQ